MANQCRRSLYASILCLCGIIGFSGVCSATSSQRKAPVVYSKTVVTIADAPENANPTAEVSKEPVTLNAQIRPASTFGDPGLLLNQPLASGEAYLIPLDTRRSYALQFARVYTPVDVLAIDEEGTVRKIIPQLTMYEMKRPIPLPSQTAAVMYLAGGETELREIAPKQRVTHPLFTPPPRILQ